MRTWSWKYSRWRSARHARSSACACDARRAVRRERRAVRRRRARRPRRKPVIPPQRVTSACSSRRTAEQVAEVGGHVAVLAGRDVHPGRRPVADQAEALEVGRATGSSNQRHAPLAAKRSRPARAPACARRRRSRRRRARRRRRSPRAPRRRRSGSSLRLARRPSSSRAGCPASTQPPSCSREPLERVRGEAAAAVDRHRLARRGRAASTSGSPSSRAFRSQSATSTAESAIEADPRPARVAQRARASPPSASPVASASRPSTTPARASRSTSLPAAAGA